jgi:hypothetical protein
MRTFVTTKKEVYRKKKLNRETKRIRFNQQKALHQMKIIENNYSNYAFVDEIAFLSLLKHFKKKSKRNK